MGIEPTNGYQLIVPPGELPNTMQPSDARLEDLEHPNWLSTVRGLVFHPAPVPVVRRLTQPVRDHAAHAFIIALRRHWHEQPQSM